MQNTQEKIVTYKEIQENTMLKWFFDKTTKHNPENKYFKDWQEYVRKEDIANTFYAYTENNKNPRTMPQFLGGCYYVYTYEFFAHIVDFITDKKDINSLLCWLTAGFRSDKSNDYELLLSIMRLLVERGADINAIYYINEYKYQPLFFHFVFRAPRLLHHFLDIGANPNLRLYSYNEDEVSGNLLHLVVSGVGIDFNQTLFLARELIESGKIDDINATDNRGNSALHLAVQNLRDEIWECGETRYIVDTLGKVVIDLINAGANINSFDDNSFYGKGRTPLDCLLGEWFGNKSTKIVAELRKAGAKTALEILGSEEKVEEFQAKKRKECEKQEKKQKAEGRGIKKVYRSIYKQTPPKYREFIAFEEQHLLMARQQKGSSTNERLLKAILRSNVQSFHKAIKAGANINEPAEAIDDYEEYEGQSFLSIALDIALSPLIEMPYDKKGFDKQKYESNHVKAFEILNTLKALNPDESKADFKAKDRLDSIIETREMELYDDPAAYGYADFEDKMSEDEWLACDPVKEYLESLEKEYE